MLFFCGPSPIRRPTEELQIFVFVWRPFLFGTASNGLIEMPRLKYCLCFSRSRSGCGSSSPRTTRSTTDQRTTSQRPRRPMGAATTTASWGTGASRSGGGDSGPRSSESSNTVREGEREGSKRGQQLKPQGKTHNLFNEGSVNHELIMRKVNCGFF